MARYQNNMGLKKRKENFEQKRRMRKNNQIPRKSRNNNDFSNIWNLKSEMVNPNKPKPDLKEIILRNQQTFKIDKAKRYKNQNKNISENMLKAIQQRISKRNNFQFQKDVNYELSVGLCRSKFIYIG